MKRSIASIAVFVASAAVTQAHAIVGPTIEPVNNYCLKLYKGIDGSVYTDSCDQTNNNKAEGKVLLKNGCASNQVRFVSSAKIDSCLPTGVVQL